MSPPPATIPTTPCVLTSDRWAASSQSLSVPNSGSAPEACRHCPALCAPKQATCSSETAHMCAPAPTTLRTISEPSGSKNSTWPDPP
eukprot:2965431-Rhodomonas_salina.1